MLLRPPLAAMAWLSLMPVAGANAQTASGSLVAAFAAEPTTLDLVRYSAGVDTYGISQGFCCSFSEAVQERPIDQPHQRQRRLAFTNWPVIVNGPADPQLRTLPHDRQVWMRRLDHLAPPSTLIDRGLRQKSRSTTNWPILA